MTADSPSVARAELEDAKRLAALIDADYAGKDLLLVGVLKGAVMVMADAMKRAKSADPKVYLAELAKTSGYKGLTGNLAFDAKGDLKEPSLTVYTYKGGQRSLSEVVH